MINNTLWLGDNEDLFSSTLFAEQNNFIYISQLDGPRQVQAKIRYAAQPAPAAISLENDRVRVDFVSPQRAVTPGQSVVYYVDDYVLGGGVIV
jgi:tRNA-specific 2-thiouridylase